MKRDDKRCFCGGTMRWTGHSWQPCDQHARVPLLREALSWARTFIDDPGTSLGRTGTLDVIDAALRGIEGGVCANCEEFRPEIDGETIICNRCPAEAS